MGGSGVPKLKKSNSLILNENISTFFKEGGGEEDKASDNESVKEMDESEF